jgi:hypothetical protein
MKRTNLVLDEESLKLIRFKKSLKVKKFFCSGIWEGNLSEMREDTSSRKKSKNK